MGRDTPFCSISGRSAGLWLGRDKVSILHPFLSVCLVDSQMRYCLPNLQRSYLFFPLPPFGHFLHVDVLGSLLTQRPLLSLVLRWKSIVSKAMSLLVTNQPAL